MTEVLQTNIFFVITSIAVLVVTVLVLVALYYFIGILRAVRDIAERVREGSEIIAEDAAQLRHEFISGNIFAALLSRAANMAGFGGRGAVRRRAKKPERKEAGDTVVRDEDDFSKDNQEE